MSSTTYSSFSYHAAILLLEHFSCNGNLEEEALMLCLQMLCSSHLAARLPFLDGGSDILC